MGSSCSKDDGAPSPLRPSVDLKRDWRTEPRIVLSNKSRYRVSYSVLQEDKKKTKAHHRRVIGSMNLRLNAGSIIGAGGGGSAGMSRTTDDTLDTEETELYLMIDHRMEPMGHTQDTEVLFPVGCRQLRVYAFFEEEDGRQWQCYKNKMYSIARRKRNVLLTALTSNIAPYAKPRKKERSVRMRLPSGYSIFVAHEVPVRCILFIQIYILHEQ